MKPVLWIVEPIDDYLEDIKRLFSNNHNHKHSANYLQYPLFQYTKFARMGWIGKDLVYYSAAVERPEYNGSIRIMSRHTRNSKVFYYQSKYSARVLGTETLDTLAKEAIRYGYKDVWTSREESPLALNIIKEHSKYYWKVEYKLLPGTENWADKSAAYQWIMKAV